MNEPKYEVSVPSLESTEIPILEKNAAPETEDADAKLLDGLEDPQQMRRIVREAILLAGGAVAILLQVADPAVGKGVDNHSNFDYRPMDRLRTTMTYVYCMVFGTRAEKEAVISMVHRAHASVKGDGYSADDPELQLWVAATLYAVGTDLHQRIFGMLSEQTSDKIYREYAVLAYSLRVKPDMWPPSRRAFWEYWDAKVATLEVTDHARNIAKDLLFNKKLPLYLRVGMPLVRLGTVEMLPPHIRAGYRFKSTKARSRMFGFSLVFTKATYPCLPKFIRTYPMRYYLKDMRRRLNDMA